MNEQTKIRVFDTAAEMRERYLKITNPDIANISEYYSAKKEFSGALDIIEAIGGAELVNEFYMYYNEVWA